MIFNLNGPTYLSISNFVGNMRICNIKHLIFTFVFVCFVQEFVTAENECSAIVNDCTHTHNLSHNSSVKNDSLENFTKWMIGKSGFTVSNILRYIHSADINNQCKEGLVTYFNGLMNFKPWALEMLDVSGKPPSSILLLTLTDFGTADDCYRIRVPSDDDKSILFKGQFCMAQLQHPLFQPSVHKTEDGRDYVDAFGLPPDWIRETVDEVISNRFGIYLGICTPSVCTQEDLSSITNAIIEPTALSVTINECTVEKEESEPPKPWPLSAKLSGTVVLSICLLCVIGTWLDLMDRKRSEKNDQTEKNLSREMLKSFSVYRNTETVFANCTKRYSIDCSHGLKALFCLFIVATHGIIYPAYWKELRGKNMLYFAETVIEPGLIIPQLNSGLVVVDALFFLSGFFMGYFLWRRAEKTDGNVGIGKIIFWRYWKLTPVHLFIILLSFFLPVINYGTVWNMTWDYESGKCFMRGWKNLLYIHNFDNYEDICHMQTWFLAASMQCTVLFIPVIVITYKYPKFGILTCLTIMFGSMAYEYNNVFKHGFFLCAINYFKVPRVWGHYGNVGYLNTVFHLQPHVIGILSGWICLKYRKPDISKLWLTAGWIFCTLCFSILLFTPYLSLQSHRIAALYSATRGAWASLGLSWIMFACTTGHGGVVDKFLTWRGFFVLSQISFSSNILNPLIVATLEATLTERTYVDKISILAELIPYILLTFSLGFVLFVMVEEPFSRMLELLLTERIAVKQEPSLQSSTHEKKEENCN